MSLTSQFDNMAIAQALIGGLLSRQNNHFLLAWQGSKIPRGAKVDDVEIGWTQHGMVTGVGGERLGFYERLIECEGHDGKTQAILLGTNRGSVTPPAGGTVYTVTKDAATAHSTVHLTKLTP